MPRYTGPLVPRDTSRGVHVRALYSALCEILELTREPVRRQRLRAHIQRLVDTFPFELTATPSDIAQILAEEDGIPQED